MARRKPPPEEIDPYERVIEILNSSHSTSWKFEHIAAAIIGYTVISGRSQDAGDDRPFDLLAPSGRFRIDVKVQNYGVLDVKKEKPGKQFKAWEKTNRGFVPLQLVLALDSSYWYVVPGIPLRTTAVVLDPTLKQFNVQQPLPAFTIGKCELEELRDPKRFAEMKTLLENALAELDQHREPILEAVEEEFARYVEFVAKESVESPKLRAAVAKEFGRSVDAMSELAQSEEAVSKLVRIPEVINTITRSSDTLNQVVGSQAAVDAMARSQAAMSKLARSEMAVSKLAQTPEVLDKMAQSEAAMSKLAQSEAAVSKLAQTPEVLNKIAHSREALSRIVGSQEAVDTIAQSETAMAKLAQSEAAMAKLAQSEAAMAKLAQSEAAMGQIARSEEAIDKLVKSEDALLNLGKAARRDPALLAKLRALLEEQDQ